LLGGLLKAMATAEVNNKCVVGYLAARQHSLALAVYSLAIYITFIPFDGR
jgi:hypothetical protein